MKITYIGQAGLLFEKGDIKILVDPYLSNSVEKINPRNYRRKPIDESLFELSPDMIILTHDHLDHTDDETLDENHKKPVVVLAGRNAWKKVLKYKAFNNCVEFVPHTEWTEFGLRFIAVKAQHSDAEAIGVIIEDGDKKYYITGDTLYSTEIFADIPDDIYALFLPVNGVGNNMNKVDGARFAKKIGAKYTVPYHVGMFDELTVDDFDCDNKVIPKIYKEIKFE